MIKKDDCYYLGKVFKTVGLDGQLHVYLDTTNPEEYYHLESVFLDLKGQLTPFFISEIKHQSKNKALVFIEDIESVHEAEKLVGADMYLPLKNLPPLDDRSFYFHEIEGFEVIDELKGTIGIAKEVLDLPNNPIIVVLNGEIEILIPNRKSYINKVDRVAKKLHISAPEGLIEMYLEEG